MNTRTNRFGNQEDRDFDADLDRYYFDFEECCPSLGWKQYDTDQDAAYFGVWVHIEERRIVTFAEGDIIRTTCPTVDSFSAEMEAMAALYGAPPPTISTIDMSGTLTRYYSERPSL